jgi:hypothetical protein
MTPRRGQSISLGGGEVLFLGRGRSQRFGPWPEMCVPEEDPRRGRPGAARQQVQRGRASLAHRLGGPHPPPQATTAGGARESTASAASSRGAGGACSPTTPPRSAPSSKTQLPRPRLLSRRRRDARPSSEPAHPEESPMRPPPERRSLRRFTPRGPAVHLTDRTRGGGEAKAERGARSRSIGGPLGRALQDEVVRPRLGRGSLGNSVIRRDRLWRIIAGRRPCCCIGAGHRSGRRRLGNRCSIP